MDKISKNRNQISKNQPRFLGIFLAAEELSSSEFHQEASRRDLGISLVTVKRELAALARAGLLTASGAGRSRVYRLSAWGRVMTEVDAKKYTAIEPDKRYGLRSYNFDLFAAVRPGIFTDAELADLKAATDEYRRRARNLPPEIEKKELERLVIELSWKSSRIEGNTYTLLDTEQLILKNKAAAGHSREEARMIINHKEAFNYILKNAQQFKTLTRRNLEELHSILVKDLGVGRGLRTRPVGITGSLYRPLDNAAQIAEAVQSLSDATSRLKEPYAQALLALAGIKYIQPFSDGNKRTARLMANAILLANSLAPLSYRSVNEEDYREATLVFYELNSLLPLKRIFLEQYKFAARNYSVSSAAVSGGRSGRNFDRPVRNFGGKSKILL